MADIFINEEILKQFGLTPTEYWILYNLYHKDKITFPMYDSLGKKGYIILDEKGNPKLTQLGFTIFSDEDPDLLTFVHKYRTMFKTISEKSGIMGDRNACIDKFKRFFKKYPEFSDRELILSAAKKYIQSESRHNYRYLQRADYFIFKQENSSRIESSRCASFCEELLINEDSGYTEEDDINTINV